MIRGEYFLADDEDLVANCDRAALHSKKNRQNQATVGFSGDHALISSSSAEVAF
jgi:hypothetical protein